MTSFKNASRIAGIDVSRRNALLGSAAEIRKVYEDGAAWTNKL